MSPSGLQAGLASLRFSSNIAAAVFSAAQPGVRAAVNWGAAELEEELRRDRRRRRRQKVIACCKKVVAFLFSHIGLAGMVVAYSILGGFLFQAIEASNEKDLKLTIREFREEAIDEIARLAENYTTGAMQMESSNVVGGGVEWVGNFTNFTDQLRDLFLEKYRTLKRNGWDLKDFTTEESDLQWSFAGALLYAVTVITTIGYGHIAPKTGWGRLLTILYALVGIPLTFLYLSNIGNFLADCFRLFYKKICCDICCCKECDKKKYRERLKNRRKQQLISARKNLGLGLPVDDDVIPDVVLNGPTTMSTSEGDEGNYPSTVEDEIAWSAKLDDEVEEIAYQRSLLEVPLMDDSCSSQTEKSDSPEEKVTQPKLNHHPRKIKKKFNLKEKPKVKEEKLKVKGEKLKVEKEKLKVNEEVNGQSILKDDSSVRYERLLSSYYCNPDDGVSMKRVKGDGESNGEYEDLQETDILVDDRDSVKETDILVDEGDSDSVRETDIVADDDDGDSILETDIICDEYIDQNNKINNRGLDRIISNDDNNDDDDTAFLLQFIHAKESDIFNESAPRKNSLLPCTETLRLKINELELQQVKSEESEQRPKTLELVDLSFGEEKKNEKLSKPINFTDKRNKLPKEKKAQKKNKKRLKETERVDLQSDQETLPRTVLANLNSGENSISLIVSERATRSRSHQIANFSSKKTKRKRNQTTSDDDTSRDGLVRANTLPLGKRPLSDAKIMVLRTPGIGGGGGGGGGGTGGSGGGGGRTRPLKDVLATNAQMDLLSPPKHHSLFRKISHTSNCSAASGKKSLEASSNLSSGGTPLPDNASFFIGDDRTVMMTSANDVTCDSSMDTTINLWPDDFDKDQLDVDGDGNLKDLDGGDLLPIIYLDDAFDYDENVSETEEKVTVPVYVCLIIIAGYTLIGACLFAGWEGWDLLTGSYFCFITLSTIGLGDIVPGSDMTEWEKLVLCALWLVIGLSLLAMCFNLMQEEVKERCKYIGQKLGLLKDDGRRV